MGEVYLARDAMLERRVAPEAAAARAGRRSRRARMLREARAAASLNHPNVCTIYEVGEIDGQHIIAMEVIRRRAAQPTAAVCRHVSRPVDRLAK